MVAHHQDVSYGCTNTNNLIESWHKVLKMKFLRDHTHRHQDRVIYCLVHHVEPYMKCKVRNENVEAGEKSSERLNELHRVKLAEGFMCKWLSSGGVDSPVKQINKMTLQVPHFKGKSKPKLRPSKIFGDASTTSNTAELSLSASQEAGLDANLEDPSAIAESEGSPQFYDVTIDWSARTISSCTCEAFLQNKSKCRHIALAILTFIMSNSRLSNEPTVPKAMLQRSSHSYHWLMMMMKAVSVKMRKRKKVQRYKKQRPSFCKRR